MVANNVFIIKEMEDNAEKRKAIEIAKNLINMKLPIEKIVLATGLTEEEIDEIK